MVEGSEANSPKEIEGGLVLSRPNAETLHELAVEVRKLLCKDQRSAEAPAAVGQGKKGKVVLAKTEESEDLQAFADMKKRVKATKPSTTKDGYYQVTYSPFTTTT